MAPLELKALVKIAPFMFPPLLERVSFEVVMYARDDANF